MSYTPTTWKSGDTVTSAKLNKIEQGIATSCANFIYEIPTDGSGEYLMSPNAELPSTLDDYLRVPWTYEEFVSKFEQGKIFVFKIPSPQFGTHIFMPVFQQGYYYSDELYGIVFGLLTGATFCCYATSPTEPMIISKPNDENLIGLLGINTNTGIHEVN